MSYSNRASLELFLPLAVVSVVGMMIFPLPSALIDCSLAINLAFSVLLLLSAVATKSPETFTTLPSLILLSTLFRLSLNVSTTRQLLTTGEAPRVVAAFGDFVVGGNIFVGLVIFLILALVQFLVVSKGAERVAEVAARFTLDALPGKQMAIDADIRSGILGISEAKNRRRDLQRESKLYGALDGAMKFVKGDAIAGLCIALLNIVAGLFVGVVQLGLSFPEALERFTVLSIGDSLVSQIPALLVSVAAGIAVTRVGESDGRSLSKELVQQLASDPRVLVACSGVLFAMGLLPGLPLLPFFSLAVLGAFCSLTLVGQEARMLREVQRPQFLPRPVSPLLLGISPRAQALLLREACLPQRITEARRIVYESSGVLVPEPEWEVEREDESNAVSLSLDGTRVSRMSIAFESGSPQRSASEQVSDFLREYSYRYLADFQNDTQTRSLLELHMSQSEDLITSLIPKQLGVTTLTRLFQDLLREKVSIRNVGSILQAISENCASDGNLDYPLGELRYSGLLASVRRTLRHQISRSLPQADGEISAWELAPEIDRILSQSLVSGSPLSPQFVESVLNSFEGFESEEESPIILCSPRARSLLSQLLRRSERGAWVLSPEEISEELRVSIRGEFLSHALREEPLRRAA